MYIIFKKNRCYLNALVIFDIKHEFNVLLILKRKYNE